LICASHTMQLRCLSLSTASAQTCTLSLHDALPISGERRCASALSEAASGTREESRRAASRSVQEKIREQAMLSEEILYSPVTELDRKSTRLNSSHGSISYAVFCLKKKKSTEQQS